MPKKAKKGIIHQYDNLCASQETIGACKKYFPQCLWRFKYPEDKNDLFVGVCQDQGEGAPIIQSLVCGGRGNMEQCLADTACRWTAMTEDTCMAHGYDTSENAIAVEEFRDSFCAQFTPKSSCDGQWSDKAVCFLRGGSCFLNPDNPIPSLAGMGPILDPAISCPRRSPVDCEKPFRRICFWKNAKDNECFGKDKKDDSFCGGLPSQILCSGGMSENKCIWKIRGFCANKPK